MTMLETPVDNGVNVEALLGAREALTQAPEAANFEWRATTEWKNGPYSSSTVGGFFGLGGEQENGTHSSPAVEGFSGLGEEQKHRTRYDVSIDHPELFA